MKKKTAYILLVILLGACCSYGQSRCRWLKGHVSIVFDSSGRMIGFPPAVIRRGDLIDFSVKAPVSFIQGEVAAFTSKLKAGSDYLTTLDDTYTCLLQDPYKNYRQTLHEVLISIADQRFLCKPGYVGRLLHAPIIHLPVKQFFRNVFKNQYEIKILYGNKLITQFPLEASAVDCKKGCVYFRRGVNTGIGDLLKQRCSDCTLDSLQFELIYHDPWNNTVVNWYDSAMKPFAGNTDLLKKVNDGLDHIDTTPVLKFDKYLNELRLLNTWFVDWLWYTGGHLTLQPFPELPDYDKNALLIGEQSLTVKIADLREQLKFNDSTRLKLAYKTRNFRLVEELQKRGEFLQHDIKNDSTQKADLQKEYSDKVGYIDKFTVTQAVLYSGTMWISRPGMIQVQKQFDATAGYRPVYRGARAKERVTEVPENESVHFVVQNGDSSLKLNFDQRRLNFDDLEKITKLLNDQLSKVDFSSITGAPLTELNSYLNALTGGGTVSPQFFGGPAGQANACRCDSSLLCLQKMLIALRDSAAGVFSPRADLFKTTGKAGAAHYQTLSRPAEEFEAPFRDSVTIQDVSKKDSIKNVAKTYVLVGGLRPVQLAAGIVFLHHPVSSTSVDTSGNGFKVSSSTTASSAVFGFKFYPIKNYNRDNSWIPRYPFRRLSVFGGFDILHPLNDFYVGGAYDLVPGLSFIAGEDIYLQTRYQIENNQILNTYKSYKGGGLFYAVTVNPILFVQFVKLFFK